MDEDIRSLLGLAGLEVLQVERRADEDLVEVELPAEGACPTCGVFTGRVHQRATKASRVLWAFLGQRRLVLVLRRRRLWCRDCHKAFTQQIPGLLRRQRVSVQAQAALLAALKEQSFAGLKRSLQIGYWQARRVLMRLGVPWCEWNELLPADGPILLGIDEHSFRGRDLVITVTSLAPRQLLAILPDQRQKTLRGWLRSLPEALKARVAGVCIDLKESYRSLLLRELPGVPVVADHFHVIQDANRRLDETRRLEQNEARKSIERWPLVKKPENLTVRQAQLLSDTLGRYPTIKEQYWLKEGLRTMYACPDARAAEAKLKTMIISAEASDDAATLIWGRTLRSWSEQLLAYFELRITNGFTEGCHTKIKLLKRVSYGFRNVEVYRRKMLLAFLPAPAWGFSPHKAQ
jgi:transposase